ncbi:MAG: guanylate kinase [Saprospiraceae bacterium]
MGRLVIITAPSGSGKSTIVHHLLDNIPSLSFSISATTRPKRSHEIEGRDYYFIDDKTFKQYIHQRRFIEWEEVYPGQFYGTLKSELHRLWNLKKTIVFDIDVVGATDLKRFYPEKSLSIYIKPPSLEVLRQRLIARQTETPEKLELRVKRFAVEMEYEKTFDTMVLNDDLEKAKKDALEIVNKFINSQSI